MLGLVTLAIYASAYLWGQGRRAYFSPDTLRSKRQTEWLIPLTEIPVYRSQATYRTDEQIQLLIDEGYWTPTDPRIPRWVFLYKRNDQWKDGSTQIHRAMWIQRNQLLQWSKNNPEIAAYVWPRILKIMRTNDDPDALVAEILFFAKRIAYDVDHLKELLKNEGIELE